MTSASLDIVAIGDAIVDVIATCDDSFLTEHGLPKGSMRVLDAGEADALYAAMGPARETSGGSAATRPGRTPGDVTFVTATGARHEIWARCWPQRAFARDGIAA